MENNEKIKTILKNIKEKSDSIMEENIYTEFFIYNSNRKVIEFLKYKNELNLDLFFKKNINKNLNEFVNVEIYNSYDEKINLWYLEDEDICINININYGNEKEVISLEINYESFIIKTIKNETVREYFDYNLLNQFLINFILNNSEKLSKKIEHENENKNES